MRSLNEKYQCWFQMTQHTDRGGKKREALAAMHRFLCTGAETMGRERLEYTLCPEGDLFFYWQRDRNSSGVMRRKGQLLCDLGKLFIAIPHV